MNKDIPTVVSKSVTESASQLAPKVGEFFRHFKHDPTKGQADHTYAIVGVSLDMEDESTVRVEYMPLYDASAFLDKAEVPVRTCTRSLQNFCGYSTVNGREVKRFKKVTDKAELAKLSLIYYEINHQS